MNTSRAEIGCGHLPGRKKPCLYLVLNGRIHPLAWFTSDEAMRCWMGGLPQYLDDAMQTAAAAYIATTPYGSDE